MIPTLISLKVNELLGLPFGESLNTPRSPNPNWKELSAEAVPMVLSNYLQKTKGWDNNKTRVFVNRKNRGLFLTMSKSGKYHGQDTAWRVEAFTSYRNNLEQEEISRRLLVPHGFWHIFSQPATDIDHAINLVRSAFTELPSEFRTAPASAPNFDEQSIVDAFAYLADHYKKTYGIVPLSNPTTPKGLWSQEFHAGTGNNSICSKRADGTYDLLMNILDRDAKDILDSVLDQPYASPADYTIPDMKVNINGHTVTKYKGGTIGTTDNRGRRMHPCSFFVMGLEK